MENHEKKIILAMYQGCALASQDFACDLPPQAKSWR
jgi:hypothetical protein